MIRIILLFIFLIFSFAGGSNVRESLRLWQDSVKPSGQQTGYELKIYPNPAENGKITLEMNNYRIIEIRLINVAGREVLQQEIDFPASKYQLLLDDIPNGIYIAQVRTTENKIVVKKLIVSSR